MSLITCLSWSEPQQQSRLSWGPCHVLNNSGECNGVGSHLYSRTNQCLSVQKCSMFIKDKHRLSEEGPLAIRHLVSVSGSQRCQQQTSWSADLKGQDRKPIIVIMNSTHAHTYPRTEACSDTPPYGNPVCVRIVRWFVRLWLLQLGVIRVVRQENLQRRKTWPGWKTVVSGWVCACKLGLCVLVKEIWRAALTPFWIYYCPLLKEMWQYKCFCTYVFFFLCNVSKIPHERKDLMKRRK